MSDNVFQKAERLVRTALGLLVRDTVMARRVWRDAAGNFQGAKGDVINVKLPAYAQAKKRALRSGAERQKGKLVQRTIQTQLTDNLYEVIPITDEELTLDVERFEEDVVAPIAGGIVRGIEDEIISEVSGAPYHNHLKLNKTKPHESIARARRLLSDARVPIAGRSLAVGSEIAERLLVSDNFVKANEAGSDQALREAMIGRTYGMDVFEVPGLDPEEAVAFHMTAYILNLQAPFVPQGAPFGAVSAFDGFALRMVQAIDPDEVVDNVHGDTFIGTSHVTDFGSFNAKGQFEPAVDPNEPESGEDAYFLRAVKISIGGPESS